MLKKKLLFKIQIKQSNIEMKDRWQIYPVVKIIDNLELIDRFIATSQPEQVLTLTHHKLVLLIWIRP